MSEDKTDEFHRDWCASLEFHRGWCAALDAVLASLKDYPLAGGDIKIMQEVERIVSEAVDRNGNHS